MNRGQRRALGKHGSKTTPGGQKEDIAQRPTDADDLASSGLDHYRAGRYEQAIAVMQQAVARNGHTPLFHSNLGAAYQAAGRLSEAVASYRRALVLQPDSAVAHHNLGAALEESGHLEEAVAWYQRALALNPDHAQSRESIAYIRGKQGERAPFQIDSAQIDSASSQMQSFVMLYWISRAIYVAAKLGISDLLRTTPRTADDLARATNTDANALRRLLLFLTSQGIFAADAEGRFRQTALSDTLRTDHPQSVRTIAVEYGGPEYWNMWGDLEQTIVTGQPAFDRMHGMSFFEQRMRTREEAAGFIATMSDNSSRALAGILAAYDFSGFNTIVDVGGGQGTILNGILNAHPGVRGTLVDLPEVLSAAGVLKTPAMADRCTIIGMDFFSDQLIGADAYILKNIIHDWDDEDALKILRNCRRGIHADGRLLIVDHVLRPPNEPDPARWSDLEMLTLLRGRERSEPEFRALLQSAGFALLKVIPTSESGMSTPIIESRPV